MLKSGAYQVSLGYKYNLSKRTSLFAAAAYVQSKNDANKKTSVYAKKTVKSMMAGLTHQF